MQYFATSKDLNDNSSSSIPWVNASVISGMPTSDDTDAQSNVAAFMKSSYCVGSIVNVSVGGITTELQRVVSPSHCEFNYVSLDPELDPFAEEFEPTQYKVCSSLLCLKDLVLIIRLFGRQLSHNAFSETLKVFVH